MELTCGFWQVWITDRDPNKYKLAWEGLKRSEALRIAADLEMTGDYYGVEVVKKSRRLPCIQ